jgi:hypothetical protein
MTFWIPAFESLYKRQGQDEIAKAVGATYQDAIPGFQVERFGHLI